MKLDASIRDCRSGFAARLRSLAIDYQLDAAATRLLFASENLAIDETTGRLPTAGPGAAPAVAQQVAAMAADARPAGRSDAGTAGTASGRGDPVRPARMADAGCATADDEAAADAARPRRPTPTLIVPGLLGGSIRELVAPLAFAELSLELRDYCIEVAWVSGRHGCDRNAGELYPQIMAAADRHGQAVHVIGYSKGCADALHLLAGYPESHAAVRSLTSLGGVVGGTPLAAHSPRWMDLALQYLPLPGVPFGDGLALDHLDPAYRRAWLAAHELPDSLRYASVVAAPSLNQVSRLLRRSWRQLAAFDEHNDSQVIAGDAMIPGSELLAVVDADHWAIALPINQRLRWLPSWLVHDNDFPRTLLLQAIIDHLDDRPIHHQPPGHAA